MLCNPQPQPDYQSTCLAWYGMVPTDLVGLVQPPAIRFTNPSYQLEKLLALPLTLNSESVVRVPCVAGSCLAATGTYHEDPGWLCRSAGLQGVWDQPPLGADHLGWVPAPPNVSMSPPTILSY